MITKEKVARLDGGLRFLSYSMGKNAYDYVFTLDLYKLEARNFTTLYASLLESEKEKYGEEHGHEYHFLYLQKITPLYFYKYIQNAFTGKIGNERQITEEISDWFDLLFNWEMPKQIYICDIRRRRTNQQGQIFLIPAGKNFLVSKWLCKSGLLD